MALSFAPDAERGSSLLEVLSLALRQLRIRDGRPAKIRARRDVELEVTGAGPAEAAVVVFARAVPSGNGAGRHEDG